MHHWAWPLFDLWCDLKKLVDMLWIERNKRSTKFLAYTQIWISQCFLIFNGFNLQFVALFEFFARFSMQKRTLGTAWTLTMFNEFRTFIDMRLITLYFRNQRIWDAFYFLIFFCFLILVIWNHLLWNRVGKSLWRIRDKTWRLCRRIHACKDISLGYSNRT